MPRIYTSRQKNNLKFYYLYNYCRPEILLFKEEDDYSVFENKLANLLSGPTRDLSKKRTNSFAEGIELHSYAVWPCCFQLVVYAKDASMITPLMRSLSTSYAMYFNRKYAVHGSPFAGKYRSIQISDMLDLAKIFRYMHFNPGPYFRKEHSSYQDYYIQPRSWVQTHTLPNLFNGKFDFVEYVSSISGLNLDLLKGSIFSHLDYQLA